jgi:hypothetical protein
MQCKGCWLGKNGCEITAVVSFEVIVYLNLAVIFLHYPSV